MAVEIKELVIRAVAVEEPARPVSGQNLDEEELSKKIVQACVKEVLRILERKKAR